MEMDFYTWTPWFSKKPHQNTKSALDSGTRSISWNLGQIEQDIYWSVFKSKQAREKLNAL